MLRQILIIAAFMVLACLSMGMRSRYNPDLAGSASWTPGSVADGEMVSQDITVSGARLGDFAVASFSLDVEDLVLDANVTSANTITATLTNDGINAGVTLSAGTVYVKVMSK